MASEIVYSMDEEKITRHEAFASEAEALEAAGPPGVGAPPLL
jgi:hypothetical protein